MNIWVPILLLSHCQRHVRFDAAHLKYFTMRKRERMLLVRLLCSIAAEAIRFTFISLPKVFQIRAQFSEINRLEPGVIT